jgi:hypothetical protein
MIQGWFRPPAARMGRTVQHYFDGGASLCDAWPESTIDPESTSDAAKCKRCSFLLHQTDVQFRPASTQPGLVLVHNTADERRAYLAERRPRGWEGIKVGPESGITDAEIERLRELRQLAA